jgi:sugar phosphate isomerase/epimerase
MWRLGINCDDDGIDGRLDRLDHDLARAQNVGFDAYELSLEVCNAIRGGRLVYDELTRVKAVLNRYPLHLTVHPPCTLNLSSANPLQRQVFLTCLEMTAQIGASVMVYHSGQMALRPADQDTTPLPDAAALRDMWQIETEQLKEMAGHASQYGIVIAIENRDPHLWEIAALVRHGKTAHDLITYHQGMRLDLIAQQVAEVGSPYIGICLDVGHAFLAAPYWPNPDYLAAIRQIAPLIRHMHVHDNFGRLDNQAGSISERLVFGEADNHMPPGWGDIPLQQVFAILARAGYAGHILVELRPRYLHMLHDIAATTRAMLADIA